MTRLRTRAVAALSGTALLATGMLTSSVQAEPTTDHWTRGEALEISPGPSNTAPAIPPDFPVMTDDVWVWDTWPLTNLDGEVVKVGGYNVIFSLTAPRDIPFPERHWYAEIGYFYSHNGSDWTYGGDLHPGEPTLSDREWAGSAYLIDGEVYSYFTASGDPNDGELKDPLQRIAVATGTLEIEHGRNGGVVLDGFDDARIILEADGEHYQTLEQSEGAPIIYAFRDPWLITDPADGRTYMLFEGNTGGDAQEHVCDPWEIGDVPPGHVVPDEARYYTGNVGIASMGTSLDDWNLEPPILAANCTNQQLERPHMVIENGDYYLFTISHEFTFAPDLQGPDGLYGFVGDSLRGDYDPLNGSGLVIGNPDSAPLQAYSWYVTPQWLAESFIDTVPGADHYGGTLAPTLRLNVQGDSTRILNEMGYGVIR